MTRRRSFATARSLRPPLRLSLVLALALTLAACGNRSRAVGTDEVSLTQRVGAALPLASRWRDADGRRVALGDVFTGGRPVLLVVGYYRCPELCGLLMHGVLEAVQAAGPRARGARIVAVSIDPDDTPATASARRDTDLAYAGFLRGEANASDPLPELHLLTGDGAAITAIDEAAGYRVRRIADVADVDDRDVVAARYAHPAALVVATPRGRISRYLMGVRFDAAELADAIDVARAGRTGTLSDRIALLCAHLDLSLGRHSASVMKATRAILVAVALALALWCWRRRGAPGRAP